MESFFGNSLPDQDWYLCRLDNSLQDNPKEFIPQLFEAVLPASAARRLSEGYKTNQENRQILHGRQNGIQEIWQEMMINCNEETLPTLPDFAKEIQF